jgi:N6-L-threonylcarbamoyladenine synthase
MGPLLLGIETSCDETSAAVVRGGRQILSNVVSSSAAFHQLFGGVVPEIAARKQVELIGAVLTGALEQAGVSLDRVEGVAVTTGPGLIGSLLVGVSAAKAIALARGIPLVGVNHLEGHIYSAFLAGEVRFPALFLIVSGGHSDLVLMRSHGQYEVLARTRDDAAGEAFDKAGRLLGLAYPGGPEIDRLAREGNRGAIKFPLARMTSSTPLGRRERSRGRMRSFGKWDFSFSGLKAAVARFMMTEEAANFSKEDIAASFQEAVVEPLAQKTMAAAVHVQAKSVCVCGGVAANSRLRELMNQEAERHGLPLLIPAISLCTDNAAMIACAGYYRLMAGVEDDIHLEPSASAALLSWGRGQVDAIGPL